MKKNRFAFGPALAVVIGALGLASCQSSPTTVLATDDAASTSIRTDTATSCERVNEGVWCRQPSRKWPVKTPADHVIHLYLTIDDGPSKNSPDVAETLRREGRVALLFPISSKLIQDDFQAWNLKQLKNFQALVAGGHLIGNHTHHHCVGPGSNTFCHNATFSTLPSDAALNEMLQADVVLRNAIEGMGGDVKRLFAPLFRAPGNSWFQPNREDNNDTPYYDLRARASNQTALSGYSAALAWSLPPSGDMDLFCDHIKESPTASNIKNCIQEKYINPLDGLQDGAIVLFHDVDPMPLPALLQEFFTSLSERNAQHPNGTQFVIADARDMVQ